MPEWWRGQNGKEVSFADAGVLACVAKEMAEGDATLEDPTALSARFPDMAEIFQRLGTLNIRNNRELAQRIVAGFEIATEVKD